MRGYLGSGYDQIDFVEWALMAGHIHGFSIFENVDGTAGVRDSRGGFEHQRCKRLLGGGR